MTTIGKGWLNWPRAERVCDRYGVVMLTEHDGLTPLALAAGLDGSRGRLVAEVTARGLSGHIDNLFRGLAPPRSLADVPRVGSVFALGEGTVFYEDAEGLPCVGVRPDDGRDTDWLDPEILYLLHEQEVELRLETAS